MPKTPTFFTKPEQFRAWLEKNHAKETELLVGFYKTTSGKPSMTWRQSVDQALCYGWIDGVRRSLGEDSYTIRFTPRRSKKSNWSNVNIARMKELIAEGRVAEAGLKAFDGRDPAAANSASYEQGMLEFTTAQQKKFKSNRAAWSWFEKSPASYRKAAMWWVLNGKQQATQEKRLQTLIDDSAAGLRVKHLRRP